MWKLGKKWRKNINGYDKFKEWREVKITQNEHICKNFLLTLDISHTMPFYLYVDFEQVNKYRLERLEVLCDFQINSFASSF